MKVIHVGLLKIFKLFLFRRTYNTLATGFDKFVEKILAQNSHKINYFRNKQFILII